MRRILSFLLISLLAGCATPAPKPPEVNAKLVTRPATFADLPGWAQDDTAAAIPAFAKSCARILKIDAMQKPGMSSDWVGQTALWQAACRKLPVSATPAQARQYFEENFTPVQATADGVPEGLFTGYYQASLRGSRTPGGIYTIPLRAKPDDLVMVNLGEFRDELKGQRIAGRVETVCSSLMKIAPRSKTVNCRQPRTNPSSMSTAPSMRFSYRCRARA